VVRLNVLGCELLGREHRLRRLADVVQLDVCPGDIDEESGLPLG
jgi:hypothetical protein